MGDLVTDTDHCEHLEGGERAYALLNLRAIPYVDLGAPDTLPAPRQVLLCFVCWHQLLEQLPRSAP